MQDQGHQRQLTQGRDLSRVALEALAIDVYRTNRITAHQLWHLLNSCPAESCRALRWVATWLNLRRPSGSSDDRETAALIIGQTQALAL